VVEKLDLSPPRSCPWCSSKQFVKNGRKAIEEQNYKCCSCERQFTARSGSFWAGMRFPKEAVLASLALKFLGKASYDCILVLLPLILGITVKSKNTLWEWVVKCEKAFEIVHKSYKKSYGRRDWHIDEIFCRVKGSTSKKGYAYILVVSDNKGNILGIHVSYDRDTESVEKAFAKIVDKETKSPKFFVSDDWKPYHEAIGFNFSTTKHVRTGIKPKRVQRKKKRYKFSVNQHERVNGDIQPWLYPMRGFKSLSSANTMANMFRMHYTAGKQIGYDEFWKRLGKIK